MEDFLILSCVYDREEEKFGSSQEDMYLDESNTPFTNDMKVPSVSGCVCWIRKDSFNVRCTCLWQAVIMDSESGLSRFSVHIFIIS